MPHTPGPWQAKLGRSMAFDVSIVNSEGFIVARTSESNGPLIAAAPDMLALLVEVFDLAPRISEDEPMAAALADWCHRVRAALAKASEPAR